MLAVRKSTLYPTFRRSGHTPIMEPDARDKGSVN
jgi:hypothetical protein